MVRLHNQRLRLYATGLTTMSGKRVTRAVRWDEVTAIRVWVTRMRSLEGTEDLQRCVLHLTGGGTLTLASARP